jgi:hypothetical protein
VGFPNVDGIIGCIVESGKATLNELKTVYDLEDAMDLFEIIVVGRFNEHLAMKAAKTKAR